MTLSASLRGGTHLLLVVGFLATLAAGGAHPATGLIFLVALLLSWRVRRFSPSHLSQLLWVALLLAAYTFDLVFLRDFVPATIRLLLALSVFKVVTVGSRRDYLLLYLISFALLLIAATFSISFVYLILLVIYLFISVLTFMLFESQGAFEETPEAPFRLRSYFSAAVVMTSVIMLLAVPIFLAIPRGSLGLFRDSGNRLSGFSNTVRLGDIGRILKSSEIVMRVQVDQSPDLLNPRLKWRGLALDYYDGKSWQNTQSRPLHLHNPSADGSFQVGSRSQRSILGQSFTVEPFSHVVFGAPDMILVRTSSPRSSLLLEDGNGSFSLQWIKDRELLQYYVYSELRVRKDQIERIRRAPSNQEVDSLYLQLPELDPRVPQLVSQIVNGQPNDISRALAIESFLSRQFGYSLEDPSAGSPDPLADFLFRTRAGHCEYFATAQAILMRVAGIPARIVNGFRRGSFNDWQNHFTVRQSDAHSWVEGYFESAGWVEFDSTPPLRGVERAGLGRLINQFLDSADLFWTQVLTFNEIKQISFFTSLGFGMKRLWRDATRAVQELPLDPLDWPLRESALPSWSLLSVLLLVAAGSVLLYRFRRRIRILWKRRILRQEDSEIAPEYYQAMLELLERKGLRRGRAETPGEFAIRAAAALGSQLPKHLTQTYYRHRFGKQALDDGQLAEIYGTLRKLRKSF